MLLQHLPIFYSQKRNAPFKLQRLKPRFERRVTLSK